MIVRSLRASCFVILVGLVAFLPKTDSLELIRLSLAALSHTVKDTIGNVGFTAATNETGTDKTTTPIIRQNVEITDVRETFDPILEAQMAASRQIGFLGKILGGPSAKMIGAWSGSPTECATNRLLFFRDGRENATVAWWTQPLMLRKGGLIPSLIGEWEIHDNVVFLSFDKATLGKPFTNGRVLTKPAHIRLKLEVYHDENGYLLLVAPNGRLTLTAADLLGGADEKRFTRCISRS